MSCSESYHSSPTTFHFYHKGPFDVEWLLPVCSECGTINNGCELKNILLHCFWPGNPSRISHLIEIDLLHIIDTFTPHLPGSSMSGFAAAIQDISASNVRELNTCFTYKCSVNWIY